MSFLGPAVTTTESAQQPPQPYLPPHWILHSALAPYIPSLIAVSIIGFLAVVHYIAWNLGHTSVWVKNKDNEPDLLTFISPPISLTGNRIPAYFIYAFGCTFFAFAIYTYAETFRLVVKDQFIKRATAINLTTSSVEDSPPPSAGLPPQTPPSPPHVEDDEPPSGGSHPAAFWRGHWRQAKSQDYTIPAAVRTTRAQTCVEPQIRGYEEPVEIVPSADSIDWPVSHIKKKRPILSLGACLLYLGLIGFAFQAIVPAEKNLLQTIGQQCRRVTSVDNLNLIRDEHDNVFEDPTNDVALMNIEDVRRLVQVSSPTATNANLATNASHANYIDGEEQGEVIKKVVRQVIRKKITREVISHQPSSGDDLEHVLDNNDGLIEDLTDLVKERMEAQRSISHNDNQTPDDSPPNDQAPSPPEENQQPPDEPVAEQSSSPDEPAQSGDEPSAEPDSPSAEPPEPSSPSAEPAEPASPSAEPSEPAEPSAEPAEPASPSAGPDEPASPSAEPDAPASPSAEPASPGAEPAEAASPSAEPAEPASPSAEPSEPASPSAEPSEPASPSAEPSEPASPGAEPSEPSSSGVEPAESASPSAEPAEPASQSAGPAEPASPSAEPASPSAEPSTPSAQTDDVQPLASPPDSASSTTPKPKRSKRSKTTTPKTTTPAEQLSPAELAALEAEVEQQIDSMIKNVRGQHTSTRETIRRVIDRPTLTRAQLVRSSTGLDHWSVITDRLLQSMTNRLQALLTEAHPINQEMSDISIDPSLIYCPEIKLSTVDWVTLLHASGAMLFFLGVYLSMILFAAWLSLKWTKRVCRGMCGCGNTRFLLRPSSLSVFLKILFTAIPLTRPLEFVQSDILRHVSMLDFAGLSQRLSILCILLYGSTLGLEIQGLRQGMRLMAAAGGGWEVCSQ